MFRKAQPSITLKFLRLTELIRIRGDEAGQRAVSGLCLEGLIFAEADYTMPARGLISPQAAVPVPGTVRIMTATRGVIENCTFENLGGYAMELGAGAQQWQARGQDVHSQIADPMLLDPNHPELGLRPGSPAFDFGFRAIDLTGLGPRPRGQRP